MIQDKDSPSDDIGAVEQWYGTAAGILAEAEMPGEN